VPGSGDGEMPPSAGSSPWPASVPIVLSGDECQMLRLCCRIVLAGGTRPPKVEVRALSDEPRPGRPRTITDKPSTREARVVAG
jgi:hypothetical protein